MDDVTIVGAGPAGATAALVLARQGVKVSLLDKSRFPRPKACAEFVSPGTSRALVNLGLGAVVDQLSQLPIRGFKIARGQFALSGYYHDDERGFASPRTRLDFALVSAAVRAGATLCDDVRAVSIDDIGGSVCVDALSAERKPIKFQSRYVIGADGINSLVSHRLGVRRPNARLRRLGIVAHMEGIDGLTDLGEMHIADGYFCGIAPFGGDTANVAMVIPLDESKDVAHDARGFLLNRLRAIDSISQRLSRARLISSVISVGPLAVSASSVWRGHVVLAGDAGGFYDPFTGQGIYRAVRGGQLAAEAILNSISFGDSERAFAQYASVRRHEFRGGWILERLIQSIVARPQLLGRLMHNLAKRDGLANTLVRVTGDIGPTRLVLNPPYLVQAFR